MVEDTTGGVIPNAQVTLTQTATDTVRHAETNDRGQFNAPFIPLGDYTVTVTAPGYETKAVSGINLQIDQTANLHVTLSVGLVSQTVQVTGAAPLVDSVTSSLGQVIDNKQILNMPLNGRNPFALGLLVGNTTPVFGMGSNLPFIAGAAVSPTSTSPSTGSTTTRLPTPVPSGGTASPSCPRWTRSRSSK